MAREGARCDEVDVGGRGVGKRVRVLFLCTGNSCRSQMAEGWARHLLGDVVDACSAGTSPHGVNPLAVRVMSEAGVDISAHESRHVGAFAGEGIDLVVTVCASAHESCPTMPGAKRTVHAGFDDPPALARGCATEEEAMVHYRRVRDEIRAFMGSLPRVLAESGVVPAMRGAGASHAASGASEQGVGTMSNGKGSCCDDSCCGGAGGGERPGAGAGSTHDTVRAGYAAIARSNACGGGGGCCGAVAAEPDVLARAIGYAASDLSAMPEGANMGLSCGNPTAIASLRPGETVVDLGSGGGFDCFIAGPKVGPAGRVIGVDMTPEMLSRARGSIAAYRKQSGLDNVEFRLGEIEALPLADGVADVVISNCVLNLSPDKARVWREISRVLKPGGRVAVSDLALVRPLPESVRSDVEALIGCVAGAVLVEETREMARAAGLVEIELRPKPEYIDAMTNWEDPLYRAIIEKLPPGSRASDYITSLDVSARKP